MSQIEAEKSVKRWRRWAANVRRRWLPDSPMYRLAERMLHEAEQRLADLKISDQQRKGS